MAEQHRRRYWCSSDINNGELSLAPITATLKHWTLHRPFDLSGRCSPQRQFPIQSVHTVLFSLRGILKCSPGSLEPSSTSTSQFNKLRSGHESSLLFWVSCTYVRVLLLTARLVVLCLLSRSIFSQCFTKGLEEHWLRSNIHQRSLHLGQRVGYIQIEPCRLVLILLISVKYLSWAGGEIAPWNSQIPRTAYT